MVKNLILRLVGNTLFMLSFAMFPTPLSGQEPVRIALRTDIQTDSSVVTLGELAEIEGGDLTRRVAMAQLDLAIEDFGRTSEVNSSSAISGASEISRREAMVRLLIAGFDKDDFRFSGASQVQIRPESNFVPEELVKEAIIRRISQGLDLDQKDVNAELLSDLPSEFDWTRLTTENLRVAPLDHGDRLIGRKSIALGVFEGDRMLKQFPVVIRTSVYREVLVASRPVERGETFGNDNTFLEKRHFDRAGNGQWSGNEALGKTATRRIRAQQLIRPIDTSSQQTRVNQPIVLRPRDVVSVVTTKGSLRITMSGMEVIKAGRVGDVIPLRNPDSKKVVFGRVIDSSRVELSF